MKLAKLLILSLFVLITTVIEARPRILHQEKSMYRNIVVAQEHGERCMIFGRLSRNPTRQSCYNVRSPEDLVFSYSKLVLAGFTQIQQPPKSVLVIGLGGGTIPMTLERLYPEASIDSVEIDPAVVRVAKEWFGYQESEKQKVHAIDGRVFVKRQQMKKSKYDVIILDAFNGDYIPEHMMTLEYFLELKSILTDDGLLMANTFSTNKLYDHESATYQKAFGNYYFAHSDRSGNRILYANLKAFNQYDSHAAIQALKVKLERIGVNFNTFDELVTNEVDWDPNAKILTDQFSPANLLKN